MTTPQAMSEEAGAHPLAVLSERGFRRFWLGLVAQVMSQQMFAFTLGWLAYEITGSQAKLGLIHLCGFVPQFALTLLGGSSPIVWTLASSSGLLRALRPLACSSSVW